MRNLVLMILLIVFFSCGYNSNKKKEPDTSSIPNLDNIRGISKKATNRYQFEKKDLEECSGVRPCKYIIKRKKGEFVDLLFDTEGKRHRIEIHLLNENGRICSFRNIIGPRYCGADITGFVDAKYFCLVTIGERVSKIKFELQTEE
jgi:hypothetical protein